MSILDSLISKFGSNKSYESICVYVYASTWPR